MVNLVTGLLCMALLGACAGPQNSDPRYMRFVSDSQSSASCKGAVAREQGMCEFGNPRGASGRPGCQRADADVQRSC